ncbi:hypothetical protein ANO11243_078510 [Dothideomycetidae sp. 11243]|nr:hypothetical protein ANO11243_078510 [fungal sp. No.11243]
MNDNAVDHIPAFRKSIAKAFIRRIRDFSPMGARRVRILLTSHRRRQVINIPELIRQIRLVLGEEGIFQFWDEFVSLLPETFPIEDQTFQPLLSSDSRGEMSDDGAEDISDEALDGLFGDSDVDSEDLSGDLSRDASNSASSEGSVEGSRFNMDDIQSSVPVADPQGSTEDPAPRLPRLNRRTPTSATESHRIPRDLYRPQRAPVPDRSAQLAQRPPSVTSNDESIRSDRAPPKHLPGLYNNGRMVSANGTILRFGSKLRTLKSRKKRGWTPEALVPSSQVRQPSQLRSVANACNDAGEEKSEHTLRREFDRGRREELRRMLLKPFVRTTGK